MLRIYFIYIIKHYSQKIRYYDIYGPQIRYVFYKKNKVIYSKNKIL